MKNEYENYSKTATSYDQTRQPIGLNIILEAFCRAPKALKNLRILDAGCGTGNYLVELIDRVGAVVGLDANQEMLDRCNAKVRRGNPGTFELHRGALPWLPFSNDSFDAIMVNQVLHHIDGDNDFPNLRQFCREAYRVLRPGGVLSINTCSHDQLVKPNWYCHFIQPAATRAKKRYIDLEALSLILSQHGFENITQKLPLDEVIYGPSYYDLDGPERDAWRAGDSFWALLTQEELRHALETYRSAKRAGTLESVLQNAEHHRKTMGQVTFITCQKPAP